MSSTTDTTTTHRADEMDRPMALPRKSARTLGYLVGFVAMLVVLWAIVIGACALVLQLID